jgi:MFS family permease
MFNMKSSPQQPVGRNYKWIALSNTTLGVFMAALNGSSLLIALPVIFRGINLDPLEPSNFAYLLWILNGYLLVQSVLVVTVGRVGDMFGRVRMYNLGFVIFTLGSILLSLTWSTGAMGATELIAFRVVQAVGGAFLMANSAAILTDAFPYNQRGLALGINMVAFISGGFVGLVAGGQLAEVGWRWVFLANVPIGVVGMIWAYIALREIGVHKPARIDWIGNLTFAAGLTMLLVALIYGINPSATSSMSWTTPFVLSMLIGGVAALVLFAVVEQRVKEPMFRLSLFRIRAFAAGNMAGLLSAIGRGGLQFMLVIWLQGIWLPLHGYSFEVTPFWAGIYMLPLTLGFLVAGPISGRLSDLYGARLFATGGMVLTAVSFMLLMLLPVNFPYMTFALLLFLNGIASGFFAAPNTAAIMNSVPAESRGVASGMRVAFVNAGMPLSIGVFFSLMIVGLNSTVPQALYNGLTQNGVSSAVAEGLAKLPPIGYLFAALLGYNPFGTLLGPKVLSSLPAAAADKLTSRWYFPQLISAPFQHGLAMVMTFSVVICLIAAAASWVRGGKFVQMDSEDELKEGT